MAKTHVKLPSPPPSTNKERWYLLVPSSFKERVCVCVFLKKKWEKRNPEKFYIYVYKFSNHGVFFEIFWYPKILWNFSCQNFRNFSQFHTLEKLTKSFSIKNSRFCWSKKNVKKEKEKESTTCKSLIIFIFFLFRDTNSKKYRVVNSLWCVVVTGGWLRCSLSDVLKKVGA